MSLRKLMRNYSVPSVGAAAGQLVGPNPNRWALVISCDATDDVTIGFGSKPDLHKGINLFKGGSPLILLYDHVGQSIREEIYAISATGVAVIGVLDIFEVDCTCLAEEATSVLSETRKVR